MRMSNPGIATLSMACLLASACSYYRSPDPTSRYEEPSQPPTEEVEYDPPEREGPSGSCEIDGDPKEVVSAYVVALDQVLFANRLGAEVPSGMIYALVGDVQPSPGSIADPYDWYSWVPGEVQLKKYKRPRPIVLRVNRGQCLQIYFRNLLAPMALNSGQPPTRAAGVFVQGLNWASPVLGAPADKGQDDGSWVGENTNSLADPGDSRTYLLYAPQQGPFLLYSTGDDFTSQAGHLVAAFGDGGQLREGLFGAVIVQPEYAEYYRSQVNREDLCLASKDRQWDGYACSRAYPYTLPEIDYQALYPSGHPREGLSVLNMVQNGMIVHSDLTAIITGPYAGRFSESQAPLPVFHEVDQTPDRLQPYREFTIIYHELLDTVQAFHDLYLDTQLRPGFESVGDNFAINYGMGGIGSEILANRLDVGPMADCTDCKYEEFFLSAWTVGDPAMIVDHEADEGCGESTPGDYTTYSCDGHQKATRAFYPDDPSNVYHAYLKDHTKFRILHGGVDLHHLHHLHAHQWLHSPNTSSGHYMDSQAIGPGGAFTLETVYDGGGNKNLTVGDSIFHCHFYPHFAAGMWAMWRVHDVFEEGTELEYYPQGRPKVPSRAYPDGEIATGTPIVALVPLPTKAMAPVPAGVRLTDGGTRIEVCTGHQSSLGTCISNLAAGDPPDSDSDYYYKNPGYPFFIASMAGSRPSHPPMDFALACSINGASCTTAGAACGGGGGVCQALDGGLQRHIVESGGDVHASPINPIDFSKDVESATGIGLPEEGTLIEKVAMLFHEKREHDSVTPSGDPAPLIANGNKRAMGAPYAEPCINIEGYRPEQLSYRDYWAVDIQTNATYNRDGWHYPQQRMISLWGDAWDFLGIRPGTPQRPPEPFFFRANSFDCVRYRLANLVPKVYELDDFQVRTPTDVLGQHIHLVKFDVTSSDGAANGFNYEDGTLAPDEVIERINAFNNGDFLPTFGAPPQPDPIEPDFIGFFGADPNCAADPGGEDCKCEVVQFYDENGDTRYSVAGGRWCGSQATFQRWYVDPQLTDTGKDKTMRTVFTHDHFSPSTHQQTGLYAALVAEPFESNWLDNQDGSPLGGRSAMQNGQTVDDGGPTSWRAVIQTADLSDSYREFLFEIQDTTLMYQQFYDIAAPACPAGVACGFCSTDLSQVCVTDAASDLYFGKVCEAVELPITNTASSSLQPSCNFIAGIPSANNLFDPGNNIFNNTNTLAAIGWNTEPIDALRQVELISFGAASQNWSLNYRNEPLYNRLEYSGGQPASNDAGDMSFVYSSSAHQLPAKADPYATPLTPGILPGDPFTPLLRAYAGDDVQIRTLVGAHQNPHNFTIHGNRWLFEPSNVNSGWRNTQTMGISEHFEMLFQLSPELEQPTTPAPRSRPQYRKAGVELDLGEFTDYLYKSSAQRAGQRSGNWGLMRAYPDPQRDLYPLPQNQDLPPEPIGVCPASLLEASCTEEVDGFFASPADANGHRLRCYSVVATSVADVFAGNELTYNTVFGYATPNAVIYMHLSDYQALTAMPPTPAPGFDRSNGLAEPLVLRAAAGDCIRVNLRNRLTDSTTLGGGYSSGRLPVDIDGTVQTRAPSKVSRSVGLRPQLVSYNAALSDGSNVGINPSQTAGPGERVTYYWYAGNVDPSAPAGERHVPIEFGATNLLPSDPMNHHQYGLFGALIIEPEGSSWVTDPDSRTSATVMRADGSRHFRDFVVLMQDDILLFRNNAQQSGVGAINYRIEKPGDRRCAAGDVACVLSNDATCNGGTCGFSPAVPIQTPLFCARKGDEARFRVLHPGGAVTNELFELHGHTFAEEPYVTAEANCTPPLTQTNVRASQTLTFGANECPDGNLQIGPSTTEWKGARSGHGPTNHYDVIVNPAGGENYASGDFLYRTTSELNFATGIWGIFRVTGKDPSEVPDRCPTFEEPY